MNGRTVDPTGDDSPFRTPWNPPASGDRTADPSVHAEPWMMDIFHEGGEHQDSPVHDMPRTATVEDETDPDHSVWEESRLGSSLAGALPESGVTWYRMFQRRLSQTTPATTWLVTLFVAAISGPMAILAAILPGLYSGYNTQIVTLSIIAPTVEEVLKVALPIWIVEKRPWLFCSAAQILLCAFISGVTFAAVENLIYLNVYVALPTPGLVSWRWTVCVLLHAMCSSLSGVGVVRVWRAIWQTQTRPDLSHAAAPMIAAIILHGVYNGLAAVMEARGFTF